MNPQQMMTEAFDKRMKAAKFKNAGATDRLFTLFDNSLHNFSLNALKFNSKELAAIIEATGPLNHYQVGMMIQVVKAVSMKMHGIERIPEIVEYMAFMESIETEFAEFANKTVAAAENEVKAKLKALEIDKPAIQVNPGGKLALSKN